MVMSRFVGSPRGLPFSPFESKDSVTISPPAMSLRDGSRGGPLKDTGSLAAVPPQLNVEEEGYDPGNEDRDHGQGDRRQPSEDADIKRPDGHRSDLSVHHVESEHVAEVAGVVPYGAVLEERRQSRPESTFLLLLLADHPPMEPSKGVEKQGQADHDQPCEKPADANDVLRRRRAA